MQPLISLKKEDFAWLLACLRETKCVTTARVVNKQFWGSQASMPLLRLRMYHSKHCYEFKRITLRMAGLHVACTFLAVIGRRFGDSGLRDL